MSHGDNLSAGSAPVAGENARGAARRLSRLAGDFARRPVAMIGFAILVVAALDTLVAPLLVGTRVESPSQETLQGWSGAHPLGTDELGRDELAQLLVGIHSSVLFAGTALVLAMVLGVIVLAAVRLAGRTRGQAWNRWAEIVLLPVVGVILLGIASLVARQQQMPADFPSLISTVLSYIWYGASHPSLIGSSPSLVLVEVLVVGEVARFGYLLVQRLRRPRAPQAFGGTAPAMPNEQSVVGSAVVVGLWLAADALLIQPPFEFYEVGLPPPPIPSLSSMFTSAYDFSVSQPQLTLIPVLAVLVLSAAFNLVGFGVRGVLRHAARP